MRTVHVTAQGANLRLSGECLEVWLERERLAVVPVNVLETIVVHGSALLTPAAMNRVLSGAIACVFLTQDGRLKGRLEPFGHPAARLRARQALVHATPAARLVIARRVVLNRLHSQLRVLRAWRCPQQQDLPALLARVRTAASLDELRGIEGWATRQYFAAVRERFGVERWQRHRRPPRDPLNALLSYGYALLLRPAWSAIATIGLDPYLGMLHEPSRGQPAAVLDLIEEFRAPLVDFLVFPLFARLRQQDDWWEPHGEGVRLTWDVRKRLIEQFEARLLRRTRYRPSGRRETVARVFELRARDLARAIQGQGALKPAW
ncbi:CRISPR-associated endonuclease Cas1 [Tepidiforma sp.]|uniref:CRISPR-associated endonuclease Cas1 n=1 Tax=Tepidiforma sp. TaxID=2682230 RepID=UPI002ADDC43A|nr:CRISPR-associated endonuclease Cas1 [Tepidiforma sp.]